MIFHDDLPDGERRHPVTVAGMRPKQLARAVADMRYDALAEFASALARCLRQDSAADARRGRTLLADHLYAAFRNVKRAGDALLFAWDVCERFEVKK